MEMRLKAKNSNEGKKKKKEKRKAKKKTYEREVTLGNPLHFVAAVFADYSYAHHIVCMVIAVPREPWHIVV